MSKNGDLQGIQGYHIYWYAMVTSISTDPTLLLQSELLVQPACTFCHHAVIASVTMQLAIDTAGERMASKIDPLGTASPSLRA